MSATHASCHLDFITVMFWIESVLPLAHVMVPLFSLVIISCFISVSDLCFVATTRFVGLRLFILLVDLISVYIIVGVVSRS